MLDQSSENSGPPDGSFPETTWAYLAGIVDGEGCITITRLSPNEKQHTKNYRFQFTLVIVNTSPALITWLHDNFGGRVVRKKVDRTRHKQTWAWVLKESAAIPLLKRLLPYMVIKRRQAEAVIELKRDWVYFRGHRMISTEELSRRSALWEEVRRLNRPGIAPAETKREDPEEGMR